MRITSKTKYPNLAKEFKSEEELASLLDISVRTLRRIMPCRRDFSKPELHMIEYHTGKSAEYLLRRRESEC